jgi:hypothetical protein
MKRLFGVLIALLLLAFLATPALADGPRGDHVCFGGSTTVNSEEMPENVVLFGCGARIQKGVQVRRDVVVFGGNVVLEEGTSVGHDTRTASGRQWRSTHLWRLARQEGRRGCAWHDRAQFRYEYVALAVEWYIADAYTIQQRLEFLGQHCYRIR